MPVTKNILPVASYQVWTSANMGEGDILGVYESLGRRVAKSITIESTGISTVRFNVVKEIYKEHDQFHNPAFTPLTKHSPLVVDTVEGQAPDFIIAAGGTYTWEAKQLAITDVKVVTSSGLRIIVT